MVSSSSISSWEQKTVLNHQKIQDNGKISQPSREKKVLYLHAMLKAIGADFKFEREMCYAILPVQVYLSH